MKKPIVAIMYDFDKTLSTTDMQNYAFIPNLGMTAEEFWGKTTEFSKKTGCERILSYMYVMLQECKAKGIKLTKEYLKECGKNIKFYPGVEAWFKRINKFGRENGVKVEHYLVSSGTKEIVAGCSIFKEFTKAYGCEYYFENGEPVWPKLAINFTQKTQYFFRIAKGATQVNDDEGVNEKTQKEKMRIPYTNIVYIGDGMTDIPCMTLVNKNNGTSIAVYDHNRKSKVKQIKKDKRVKYICPADYREGGSIDKVLKIVIKNVSFRNQMAKIETELLKDE